MRARVAGKLPGPGNYTLCVDSSEMPLDEIRKKDEDSIRAIIEEWIVRTAPQLKIDSPPHHMKRERVKGVPFDICLTRFPRRDGQLYFAGFSPDDLTAKTKERVGTAIDKKCGKLLMETNGNAKAVSILLLENFDWSLGNDCEFARAAFEVFSEKPHLKPQELYVVNTGFDTWDAGQFIAGGRCVYPDERDQI
jgi:hypothetical protein